MLAPVATQILAAALLAAIGVGLVVWARRVQRRSPFRLTQAPIFALNYVLARVLWRARIQGRIELPPGQGAVIVCNHRCPLDPSFIALAADRLVHWMVAREYCEMPGLRLFFRLCEVIPVSRAGSDTGATKTAMRYARQGDLLGIFPEGRINDTPRLLLPGRPGAAKIALIARVPVIPCYIDGAPYDGTFYGCLFMPAKVRLRVGRPIDLAEYYGRENDRDVLEQLTHRFLREIAALAGENDYPSELAGRFYKPRR